MQLTNIAATVAKYIPILGSTAILDDGKKTVIKVVPDEDAQSLHRIVGQAEIDAIRGRGGRPILFYMTDADYKKIPGGTQLTYDDQLWTLDVPKNVKLADSSVARVLLGVTGGD